MPADDEWTRSRARRQKARMWLAAHTTWPTPCQAATSPKCRGTLHPLDPWVLGHTLPRKTHPELMWTPTNWRVECRPCSDASGRAVSQRGKGQEASEYQDDVETRQRPPKEAARGISSGRKAVRWGTPRFSPPYTPQGMLVWQGIPWIKPLIDQMRPEDVWPRLMTAPHPKATGSYGTAAIARIEARRAADPLVPEHEKPLRFFQRLVLARAYEHDADGRLLWRTVCETTNRQVGKSVLAREAAIDRGWHTDRLGELQMVVHVARDLSVAEEVQLPARTWARSLRMEFGDRRFKAIDTNGKAEVQGPGFRWVSRSEKGAYGWSACLALADECWDIEPATIHNGLLPTMAARRESQLWLFSTAHESCTGLFPEFRNRALAELGAPTNRLLVEWSADPALEDGDEAGWRAASPWFDAARRDLLAENAGSHGFREQWLNIWPETATRVSEEPLLVADAWGLLLGSPTGAVAGVAVEAAAGLPPVVAEARVLGDGSVCVSVRQAATVAEAAGWCSAAGVPVLVGKSLLHDPAWQQVQVEPKSQTSADACSTLRRLVGEGALRHDGGKVLGEQVVGTVVAGTVAGLRVVSKGRTDAVKACVWAAEAARAQPERPMIW